MIQQTTTAQMAPDTPELETEVRDLVRRIVDGLVDDTGAEPAEVAAPSPAPVATSGGEVIAVGADHGGYALKERIAFRLREAGYEVHDCGTDGPDSVDYPVFAHEVARLVAAGDCRWGIVIDGAGIGSAMTANKVPGVRAALCYDLSTARNSREHNLANVLTLGAGMIGDNLAWQIVQEWLKTPWGGDRHARRVGLITDIEQRYARSEP
jgi:ribose 5-phosphate isomerase B